MGAGPLKTDRAEYRKDLIALEQRAQEAYDTTLLTLSGGALGVSFAFVKDFLGLAPAICPGWLVAAWVCWVSSLAAVLLSHYLSAVTIRRAIERVDRRDPAGERMDRFELSLVVTNTLGGLLFVIGLLCMGRFVALNI